MAQRELLAGVFSAPPVRVHVYTSSGAHLFVGADGAGCWSDPQGNVLVYTLADAKALLLAHGYVLDEDTMAVSDPRVAQVKPWTPPDDDTIMSALKMLDLSLDTYGAVMEAVVHDHAARLEALKPAPVAEQPPMPESEQPQAEPQPDPEALAATLAAAEAHTASEQASAEQASAEQPPTPTPPTTRKRR